MNEDIDFEVYDTRPEDREMFYYSLGKLESISGIGHETAIDILMEIGVFPRDLYDAGIGGLSEVEGVGETTARRIVDELGEVDQGWEGSVELKISYEPDQDRVYTANIAGTGQSHSGEILFEALEKFSARTREDELIEHLGIDRIDFKN
jgi:Holliday junction resolvasome RuvABC DNA-binding subunit